MTNQKFGQAKKKRIMETSTEQARKLQELRTKIQRLSTRFETLMASNDGADAPQSPGPLSPNTTLAVENALNYFDHAIIEDEVEGPEDVEQSEINLANESVNLDMSSTPPLPPPPPTESVSSLNSARPISIASDQPISETNGAHSSSPEITGSPRDSHVDVSVRDSSRPTSVGTDVASESRVSIPPESPRTSQLDMTSATLASTNDVTMSLTSINRSENDSVHPEPFANSQLQIPPPPPIEGATENNNTSKNNVHIMTPQEDFKSNSTYSDLYWKRLAHVNLGNRERKLDRRKRALIIATGVAVILIVLLIAVCVLVIVFVYNGLQKDNPKPVVTVQILDGSTGKPAVISDMLLTKKSDTEWKSVGTGWADEHGQITNFKYTFEPGMFRISFQNQRNSNKTQITFTINEAKEHVFIPIILNAQYDSASHITSGAFTGNGLP